MLELIWYVIGGVTVWWIATGTSSAFAKLDPVTYFFGSIILILNWPLALLYSVVYYLTRPEEAK